MDRATPDGRSLVKALEEDYTVLQRLLLDDPLRYRALAAVAALDLEDCWIGAGFVRDALWDFLHGYDAKPPSGDVDVVWYDAASGIDRDRSLEQRLHAAMPNLSWSVKNQARMHHRNDDAPYASVADAMRHWPETATAIAARLTSAGSIELNAPLGLDDLFAMRLRPTPRFLIDKLPLFTERVTSKRWVERYPKLSLETKLNIR